MDSLAISASGMRVAALRRDAAAANVARWPLHDAPRVGVNVAASGGGGVQGRIVAAGPDVAAPVAELVEGRQAALTFDANARVLKAGGDRLGFLLDVLA